MKYSIIIILGVYLFLSGCSPEPSVIEDKLITRISIDLADTIVQEILDFQDRFVPDSLLGFFDHHDPTYRYLAAGAFASIQDPTYVEALIPLLEDPMDSVKQMAAYALGQLGDVRAESALISAFQAVDTTNTNHILNETILEAVGKCASASYLPLISSVSTYKKTDDHLLRGQAKAIYRYMLRDVVVEEGTAKMIELLADPDIDKSTRVYAAAYLSRAKDLDLSGSADLLSLVFENETNADIKLFLPQVLLKTQDAGAANLLNKVLRSDADHRLRCNIIKAFGSTNYRLYRNNIQSRIHDRNIHVATTAAETILQFGEARYWKSYMTLSLGEFPWQIKTALLHAVSKFIPAGNDMFRNINEDLLMQRYRESNSVYQKAAAVEALAEYPGRYKFIISELDKNEDPVIRTGCIQGLITIVRKPVFNRLSRTLREAVVSTLHKALLSGDVGEVEIAANILKMPQINLTRYQIDTQTIRQQIKERLQLPRDIEAYLAIFPNSEEIKPGGRDYLFTHGLDWKLLSQLGDTVSVSMETNRGTIDLELYPKMAPGTVANFVDLVNVNYYADKPIHRVVPGFVIQGGCNRGDGYGSLDYNIRSDLSQVYYDQPGYIGMASAGNHTESAQWFITQGPTPHLDGKYSLFGKVIDGLDVIYATQIGDKIQSIRIL